MIILKSLMHRFILILQKNSEKRRLDFEIDSYFMIEQLNKIIKSWKFAFAWWHDFEDMSSHVKDISIFQDMKKEDLIQISKFVQTIPDVLNKFEKENIVVQVSDTIKATTKDLFSFLNIAKQKKQNGTSFVLINSIINIRDFPENFNIVPTMQEAEDIIEMETIERELGF